MSVLYCCGSIASGASDLQWGMSKADVIAIMGEGQTNLDKIVSAENETKSKVSSPISSMMLLILPDMKNLSSVDTENRPALWKIFLPAQNI